MLIIICVLQYFFVPVYFKWPVIALECTVLLMLIFLPGKISDNTIQKVVMRTVLAACMVNLYLNLAFYPSLMEYQGGSRAAMWINQHNPTTLPVMQCEDSNWPMEFYLNQPLLSINPDTLKTIPTDTFILYSKTDIINHLIAKGWHIKQGCDIKNYWVSRLKPKFLNINTRDKELTDMQVVLVNGSDQIFH